MLLWRIVVLFVFQHFERTNQRRARIFGINHRIDVTRLGGFKWIGKGLAIVGHHLIARLRRITSLLQLPDVVEAVCTV